MTDSVEDPSSDTAKEKSAPSSAEASATETAGGSLSSPMVPSEVLAASSSVAFAGFDSVTANVSSGSSTSSARSSIAIQAAVSPGWKTSVPGSPR